MIRSLYLAAIPVGVDGLLTLIGFPIEPVVVLKLKPEMLADPLFEVYRNAPLDFTLLWIAMATGREPVGCDVGVKFDKVPSEPIL
jgi:hypothetical protein